MDTTFASAEERLNETEDTLQLVGFKIANELFGVDILMVQEIIKHASITPIPDAADFIKGVINLRGNIIPIIDLRKRFNIGSRSAGVSGQWIIILNINDRVTGFIVDHVTRVIKVQLGAILPPPEILSSGFKSDYISGVYRLDQQGLLAILDFNRILVVDEFKKAKSLNRAKTH
jgi:purine-binding chemotaxis protein CheW